VYILGGMFGAMYPNNAKSILIKIRATIPIKIFIDLYIYYLIL
tara:strand:+ start:677 stop:805 length:129 start_codon:yes stop_codon:yes gene_type:complete